MISVCSRGPSSSYQQYASTSAQPARVDLVKAKRPVFNYFSDAVTCDSKPVPTKRQQRGDCYESVVDVDLDRIARRPSPQPFSLRTLSPIPDESFYKGWSVFLMRFIQDKYGYDSADMNILYRVLSTSITAPLNGRTLRPEDLNGNLTSQISDVLLLDLVGNVLMRPSPSWNMLNSVTREYPCDETRSSEKFWKTFRESIPTIRYLDTPEPSPERETSPGPRNRPSVELAREEIDPYMAPITRMKYLPRFRQDGDRNCRSPSEDRLPVNRPHEKIVSERPVWPKRLPARTPESFPVYNDSLTAVLNDLDSTSDAPLLAARQENAVVDEIERTRKTESPMKRIYSPSRPMCSPSPDLSTEAQPLPFAANKCYRRRSLSSASSDRSRTPNVYRVHSSKSKSRDSKSKMKVKRKRRSSSDSISDHERSKHRRKRRRRESRDKKREDRSRSRSGEKSRRADKKRGKSSRGSCTERSRDKKYEEKPSDGEILDDDTIEEGEIRDDSKSGEMDIFQSSIRTPTDYSINAGADEGARTAWTNRVSKRVKPPRNVSNKLPATLAGFGGLGEVPVVRTVQASQLSSFAPNSRQDRTVAESTDLTAVSRLNSLQSWGRFVKK